MRIAIRRGHNFQAIGAEGIVSEVKIAEDIKNSIIKYLKACSDVEVLDVSPSNCDTNTDLSYGVNTANEFNADFFCSIHLNSATPQANGCEVWGNSIYEKDYAERICDKLSSLGFYNRGFKQSSAYYEIKNTKMSCNIIEVFFCTSQTDVDLYNSIGVDKIGKTIAEGIVGYEIVIKEEPTITTPIIINNIQVYPVLSEYQEAEQYYIDNNADINNALYNKQIPSGHWHWEISGRSEGRNSIFDKVTEELNKPAVPKVDIYDLAIIGAIDNTHRDKAISYIKQNNSHTKLHCTVEELVDVYINEATKNNVNWLVPLAMSIKETGFWSFTGDARWYWNNYCGLGITGAKFINNTIIEKPFCNGVVQLRNTDGKDVGVFFEYPYLGIRGQIQHLMAYCCNEQPIDSIVDPRFTYVSRGVAPKVIDLGGKWAVPGFNRSKYSSLDEAISAKDSYGHNIIDIIEKIKNL